MKELMLELLTYEPFGKFLSEEKTYIQDILSENYQQPPSEVHDLFSGFYNYVQRGATKNIAWLRIWRNTYHQKQKNKDSTTSIRSPKPFPLLFKKISFYIIVRGNFSDKEFRGILDIEPNFAKKWGISPKFRRYAEADTYSEIKIFRNGVKKEYVVSAIKKLYYETGRQVSRSMKLKDQPAFLDIFAGSATVSASVVTEGCPPPIINDYDPVMVCFAWAFVRCKSELRKKIANCHNKLMEWDFASTGWSYDSAAYEKYVDEKDPKNVHINPKRWDDADFQWTQEFFYRATPKTINDGKKRAQKHQEFIMRVRSSYIDNKEKLEPLNPGDRDDLRSIDFNNLSPHSIKQFEKVLEYAFVIFYYCSFALNNKVHHESAVNTKSYYKYLKRLKVDLSAINQENWATEAEGLTKLRLEADSLSLESTGHFPRYLQDAKFYCKDFRWVLQDCPLDGDGVYYLDSPYFLTVGYDVDFSDEDHKDMLDILRDADFKWIFSMQFNPSETSDCTSIKDKAKRRDQQHIIKDYGSYYSGFCVPFQLDADQRTYYVPTDAPMEKAKNLYVVLFDFDAVWKKWPNMRNTKTREILVVNFDCLPMIPLHDSAVVYPFDLFWDCADKADFKKPDEEYRKIVQKAIDWRKKNIESNYAGESPV